MEIGDIAAGSSYAEIREGLFKCEFWQNNRNHNSAKFCNPTFHSSGCPLRGHPQRRN
jgi:hypothetical protein